MKKIYSAAILCVLLAAAALSADPAGLAFDIFSSSLAEAETFLLNSQETASETASPMPSPMPSDAGSSIQQSKLLSSGLRSKFYSAAVLFEQSSSADPHHLYNAGSAYWWAGDYPRAIIAFRKYLEIHPFDHKAQENLVHARTAAQTEKPSSVEISGRPVSFMLMCAGAFFAGLSLLFAGLVFFVKGKKWTFSASAAAAAAVLLFSSALIVNAVRKPYIVIAQETYGYKGDSAVYDVSPAQPWKAGQEMILLENRGNWILARCGGRESWLPSSSVIFLQQQNRR